MALTITVFNQSKVALRPVRLDDVRPNADNLRWIAAGATDITFTSERSGDRGISFVDIEGYPFRVNMDGGVDSPSLLLNVTTRFGKGRPTADLGKSWGHAGYQDGDTDLLIFVENRPAQTSVKMLTYNTHLFKGSPAARAEPLADIVSAIESRRTRGTDGIIDLLRSTGAQYVEAFDDERAAELVKRVLDSDADVVCLQEVWGLAEQSGLIERLVSKYPHSYMPPNDTITDRPWWQYVVDGVVGGLYFGLGPLSVLAAWGVDELVSHLRNELSNSSGLLVLSRHPLADASFEMFHDLESVDALAKKGVVNFTVLVPSGEHTVTPIRMATTHCPTDFDTSLDRIRDVVVPRSLLDNFQDRILLGDLNLHQTKTQDEYAPLNEIMRGQGATDVVRDLLGSSIDDTYTDWQAGNSLTWVLDEKNGATFPPKAGKDRIDYVYFTPAPGVQALTPQSVSIPRDWDASVDYMVYNQPKTKIAVSDHWPVFTTFDLRPPARVAAAGPVSTMLSNNQEHIFYRGADRSIRHVCWGGAFHRDVWTFRCKAPTAAGNPATMVTPDQQHVFYRADRLHNEQPDWRYCKKCHGLFYSGLGNGVCKAGGAHDGTDSAPYVLPFDAGPKDAQSQDNWRWCRKCQQIFWNGQGQGACAAGGGHDPSGSGAYFVATSHYPLDDQDGWSWCKSCKCLHHAYTPGVCPATGGPHSTEGSGQYYLKIRGTAGQIQHMWWDQKNDPRRVQSENWTKTCGAPLAAGDPATMVTGDQQHVFYRGLDGHLQHMWWSPTYGVEKDSWTVKAGAPTLAGNPVTMVTEGRVQHVFYRSQDGHIQHLVWNGSFYRDTWTQKAGAPLAVSDPVTMVTDGQQHVFYRSQDGHIQHIWWSAHNNTFEKDSWTARLDKPKAVSDPVVCTSPGQQHLFYRSADGHIQHIWYDGALRHDVWTANAAAPMAVHGPSAMVDGSNGYQHVFYVTADGTVRHIWWDGGKLQSDVWSGMAT